MGYSYEGVTFPALVLDADELFAGVCKEAGHTVITRAERWSAGGGSGRQGIQYCRRCVVGLRCAQGHDLTDPDNVIESSVACKACKADRQREYRERTQLARAEAKAAREALGTKALQSIINTTGPAPRWLTSGWPPRAVLDDGRCGDVRLAKLFDSIEKKTEDHEYESTDKAEARIRQAATLCAACPVRELCKEWATNRYLVYGETRVAGGLYFGPRKSVSFAKDSKMISEIKVP